MCGISAYVSEYKHGFTLDEASRFKMLTWITQLRGSDSTGVIQFAAKSGLDSIKRLNGPAGLFSQEEYRTWETKLLKEGKLAFSHCRAATKGTVNIENAHPFYVPREDEKSGITLIHNGTLHHQHTLPDYAKFDVDSKWLAHCIAKYGAEEALAAIDGPISSMWFDNKDNTFNVYTNGERPLSWTQTKGGALVINSEAANIVWVLSRVDEDFAAVQDVPHRELWTFSAPDYLTAKVTKITKRPTAVVPVRRGGLYGENEDERWNQYSRGHYTTPAVNDDAEYYALPRGFDEDCKLLWEGKILSVRFFKEYNGITKTTIRPGGIPHRMYNQAAYREGLQSMIIDPDDKTIIITQTNEEGTISVLRFRQPTPAVTSGKVIELPNRQSSRTEWAIPNVKFRKGKNISFVHEAPGGGTVKHQARCDATTPEHFTWYQNSSDGIIKAGDKVFIEHYDIEERNKYNAVFGFRVYPEDRQDLHIEYVFFDTRNTKKQIQSFDMYTGKISYIRLNTVDRYNGTSNIIQVVLTDVHPVDTKALEEKENAPSVH